MHPSELGPDVVLLDVADVEFDEVPAPTFSPTILSAIDDAWNDMVRINPAIFGGPVVLCSALDYLSPHLSIRWSRATYRYRTVRQIPGAPALSSIFVSVLQPTTDGRLLAGHMSQSTSSPGVLQLPGGNLEPPLQGNRLTTQAMRQHAATELAEETGIHADPHRLTLWAAARTSNGNVGFFFLAPPLPADFILQCHASVVAADHSNGTEPEFAKVTFLFEAATLRGISARPADYLAPLLDRFAT